MKTNNQISSLFYLTFLLVVFSATIFSQNYDRTIDPEKKDAILANYERCLNSENPGVRIETVRHVGRYKISNFENKLIEMLHDETNIINKKIIVLSLSQLGSLNAIAEIKQSIASNGDLEYKEFCSILLNNYAKYDILRSKYFDTVAVNLIDEE